MRVFIVAADKFDKYPIGVASRPEEVRKIVEAHWSEREDGGAVPLHEYWVLPATIDIFIPNEQEWTPLEDFYEHHP